MPRVLVFLAVLPLLAAFPASLASGDGGRPELGDVQWVRNHDLAFEQAKEADKPVFVFFQEVPG